MEGVEEILGFWFGGGPTVRRDPRVWFAADAAFDQACTDGFLADHERAATGALDDWQGTPRGTLALILLLDQFPRNMFRSTPRAFATDQKALGVAKRAVARRFDRELTTTERAFVYLPFEHSENLGDQDAAVRLFGQLAEQDPSASGYLKYAQDHMDVIRRFGRFPHRNAILGRTSTPDEVAFVESGALTG